ncbi:MAG: class I SAM-dependent methyltransferase [Bacteroidia bacterium]|nr:class I SAM-dependent methyltransferase [Bacteroidia bacterium]
MALTPSTPATRLSREKMLEAIKERRDFVLSNFRILRKVDPNDHYWKSFENIGEYVREGEIFETGMVQSWIGSNYSPKTILEIGTRTGGSLISLLTAYNSYTGLEIVSFDLWREYFSVTWLSRMITRLKGSADGRSNINISRKYMQYFDFLIRYLSTGKVKRNLRYFNIPTNNIQFVSGDSRITVPEYFRQNPNKKFDYILVDGAHDEETALIDLRNVANYVATGGFLLFDDIGPEGYKLGKVWEQFRFEQKDNFDFYEVYHRKGVAWAIKK